jgi:glycosyltransferase involved in cell wall biosynthesis
MGLCQRQLPTLNLIIIGGGPELPYLKQIAIHEGLSSRIFDLGFIQPKYLYEAMGAIDVALMNLTAEGLKDLGPVTTRFATYAAFQIPVIANSLYIENYPEELVKGLYTVPHEDPNILADIIFQLYKNPKDRKEKARILYKFVSEKMTWDAVSKNILKIIKNNIKL